MTADLDVYAFVLCAGIAAALYVVELVLRLEACRGCATCERAVRR